MATEPEVLLLDEPTSALDVSVQAQILKTFERLRKDFGVALVLVSHDLAVVRALCDTVLVMHQGRIVEAGAVTEVLGDPREAYTRQLIEDARR